MKGKVKSFWVDVNPEPWVVPPFYAARSGKHLTVRSGRDQGLHAYQEAVREQLIEQGAEMLEGPYGLRFHFYVDLEKYTTATGRKVTQNTPDVTNLQKAIEDALQGVVIHNDREVVYTASSRRMSEGALAIVEVFYELEEYPDISMDASVEALLNLTQRRAEMTASNNDANAWPPRKDS